MGKKAKLALIAPLLSQLIDLLGQLERKILSQLSRQELIDAISGYGVILTAELLNQLSNNQLLAILYALNTVGGQLSRCLPNADTLPPVLSAAVSTTTAGEILAPKQQVFQAVFPTLTFTFDPNANFAHFDPETNTITLVPSDFWGCRLEDVEGNRPADFTVESQIAPCPEGIFGTDDYKYKWVPFEFQSRTSEGIIRHEIGHAFLNELKKAYEAEGGNFEQIYNTLIYGNSEPNRGREVILAEFPPIEQFRMERLYLPNVTEHLTNYDDSLLWKEDFADIFSLMGRFIIGDEAFANPEVDPGLLANTVRVGVFQDNFCSWVSKLIR